MTQPHPSEREDIADLRAVAAANPEQSDAALALIARLEAQAKQADQDEEIYAAKRRLAKQIAEDHRTQDHIPLWVGILVVALLLGALAYAFVKHAV